MATRRGVIRSPTSGELIRILMNGADSDLAFGLVEMAFAAGSSGPPLHVHPTHGEGFYVLSGELSFQIDDEVISGGPGTWAFAPPDVPHTLANLSDQDGRLLCLFTPAGFERRFERILAEQTGTETPGDRSDAERATRTVGPPIGPRT